MRTILARKRTMIPTADTMGAAQPRLLKLVKRAEVETGSRMLAYQGVARRIGTSPSWVRKFLGNQAVAEPSFSVGANIVSAFREAFGLADESAAYDAAILEDAFAARSQMLARLTACEAALGLQDKDDPRPVGSTPSGQDRARHRTLATRAVGPTASSLYGARRLLRSTGERG